MKTNAMLRIIVWAVVALLLLGVLAYFLMGGGNPQTASPEGSGGSRADADTSFGGAQAAEPSAAEPSDWVSGDALSGVTKLEINWLSGVVRIEEYDGELSFRDSYAGEDERYCMRWRVGGNTLYIDEYVENVSLGNPPTKNLTVSLPRACMDEIKVNAASAEVVIDGAQTKKLSVSSVSGDVGGRLARADEVDLDTISGDVVLTIGRCGEFDAETTSGEVEFACFENLQSVDLSAVSGSATVYLPAGFGYRLDWDTVSGRLIERADSRGVAGAVEIEAESVSGGLFIDSVPYDSYDQWLQARESAGEEAGK